MESTTCLNCGSEIRERYCGSCGQSAHTHRFSLTHIFAHDLVHGVFHVDKGFLYTAREIIIRPGVAVRSYIQGKRVSHYNYFAFIILLVAINHILLSATHFSLADLFKNKDEAGTISMMQQFMLRYQKLIILGSIPIYALSSFFMFRKAKMNFAGHLVVNAYLQGGILMINTVTTAIIIVLFHALSNIAAVQAAAICLSMTTIFFTVRFYWQYFYPFYNNKIALFYRSMQVLSLPMLIIGSTGLAVLKLLGKI
jgi:hypothetical protein